jgi:predicted hydrocarbon binding protein
MTETKTPDKFSEFVLPDNYIEFSPITAEIFVNRSRRGWALDPDFIISIHHYLANHFGIDHNRILYETGFQWGDRAYQQIESLALSLYPDVKSIKALSMDQFHRLFTNHMAATGWGNFELKRRDDFLFVDLYRSLYVDMLKAAKPAETDESGPRTVCYLYSGFFAGLFSRISQMPLACVEITCEMDGYENCSFLLDNADTIASVNAYIADAVSPLDAFQKVKKQFE